MNGINGGAEEDECYICGLGGLLWWVQTLALCLTPRQAREEWPIERWVIFLLHASLRLSHTQAFSLTDHQAATRL